EPQPSGEAPNEKPALPSGKPLLRQRFDSIDDAEEWLHHHPDCLVELTIVSVEYLKATDKERLYDTHRGIVTIIPEIRSEYQSEELGPQIRLDQSMGELFKDYFKYRHGQDPSEEL